jgi:hypothetical protein
MSTPLFIMGFGGAPAGGSVLQPAWRTSKAKQGNLLPDLRGQLIPTGSNHRQ